jgi:putative ABC transport system substrate-binding protein
VIDRRAFISGITVGLLAAPLAGEGQQPEKGPVIGFLHPGVPDPVVPAITALRQGLQGLGYIEGQNIRLEYRWAGGRLEKLPGLAADLVRLNVDVIYAVGPQAIRTALGASRTIAIVGSDLEGDPIESGFVASYARPGGNITGLFLDLPGLTGKWLQLVREVAPATRRVAALWDASTGPHQLRALTVAAKAAAMELQVLEVRRPAEYEDILKTAMRGRPHALIQLSSPLIRQASRRVAEFTVANRLPAISMFIEFAASGGLMAYGPDLPLFFRRAASLVDKILKGARSADLPIERPEKFELVINLKTAKALGLTIPPSLLQRADRVIE